ncbi:hypothetical protein RA19_24705 [Leisingera sp. ANG-M1]|nr:hypothetical protein RA19_24705 [Leisingera sp. ANG-M1]
MAKIPVKEDHFQPTLCGKTEYLFGILYVRNFRIQQEFRKGMKTMIRNQNAFIRLIVPIPAKHLGKPPCDNF